jgi:hypothetical protein
LDANEILEALFKLLESLEIKLIPPCVVSLSRTRKYLIGWKARRTSTKVIFVTHTTHLVTLSTLLASPLKAKQGGRN